MRQCSGKSFDNGFMVCFPLNNTSSLLLLMRAIMVVRVEIIRIS